MALADHHFSDVYSFLFRELGEDYDPGYEALHIYVYGMLYDMGVYANVEIIKRRYLLPLGFWLEITRYQYGISSDVEKKLINYLASTNRLVQRDGRLWIKENVMMR